MKDAYANPASKDVYVNTENVESAQVSTLSVDEQQIAAQSWLSKVTGVNINLGNNPLASMLIGGVEANTLQQLFKQLDATTLNAVISAAQAVLATKK